MSIYLVIFFFAFIENIFPPVPSDIIIVFAGYIAGTETVGFLPVFIVAVMGSTAGFMTMFGLGRSLGKRIVESGKLPLIPVKSIHTAERWFRKWGYGLIAINRFLSGTRAVIAFFAGLAALRIEWTFLLAALSSILWNALLLYAGFLLGENWRSIGEFFKQYRLFSTLLITVVLVSAVVYIIFKNVRASRA